MQMDIDTIRTNQTVGVCLELANQLRQEDKLDEAIDIYLLALEIKPNSSQLYQLIGEALAKKDNLEAAANFYNLALQIDPHFGCPNHCLGKVSFRQSKLYEAIATVRKAIELEVNRAEFYYQLGLYLEYKLDLNGAIVAYTRAVQLDPSLTEASCKLEVVLTKQEVVLAQKSKLVENSKQSDLTEKKDREVIDLKTLLSEGRITLLSGVTS